MSLLISCKWFPRPSAKWWVIPPLVVALSVVVVLIALKTGPQKDDASESSRVLRVIELPVVDVVPRALGYGTAEPARVWQAVAEVEGRILEVHDQLRPGAMIGQGETLLKIDPAEYDLAIARLESEIVQVNAQLAELATKEANDQASLEIEESSLKLVERELARIEPLVDRDAVTQSELDRQRRNVLTQRQNVQQLRNALQLVPPQRKLLHALIEVKNAGLAQTRLDREKTIIKAPLDCRLGELNLTPGQFLAAGQPLFETHGTAATELEAQLSLHQLRNLIRPELRDRNIVAMGADTVQEVFDFEVVVRFRSGEFAAEWSGRVVRLRERHDPRTRMIGLVVAVDKPYEKAIPGQRPPLVKGMFCEIELRGAARPRRIVVPRSAVHDGFVYVISEDQRLVRRDVEVEFVQSHFACLLSGVSEGEMVVVSDPTPAIEGALVESVPDDEVRQQLIQEAGGAEAVK